MNKIYFGHLNQMSNIQTVNIVIAIISSGTNFEIDESGGFLI